MEETASLMDGTEVRVEPIGEKPSYDPNAPSIEDEIARIAAEVPAEVWDRLPRDLNDQLDHYVYGTPRR